MVPISRSLVIVMLVGMLPGLGGCITDQLMPSSAAASGAAQATVTISRSDDLAFRAAAASVELNGKSLTTLAAGRTYTGQLPAGQAVIKVSAWTAPISIGSHRLPSGSTSYRFNVEAGKTYSFTISPRTTPATQEASADTAHDSVSDATGSTSAAVTEGSGGPFQISVTQ
jgi:hypothetical protein